mgnify:CR=1 FL=1
MKVEGSLEFTVVEQTADRVVSEMPIHSGVKNPFGVVHAGAMLWLADVTATMLVLGPVQTAEGMKGFPLAITLNASFASISPTACCGRWRRSSSADGRSASMRTLVSGAGDRLVADVTTNHVRSQ